MDWVVSLETGGDAELASATAARALAAALCGMRATVEPREHGYGVTLLLDCDDPESALSVGVRALRDAEERAGLAALPLVCAEVTAASEIAGVYVPYIAIYAYKGLYLTIALQFVYIALSVAGWREWRRTMKLRSPTVESAVRPLLG